MLVNDENGLAAIRCCTCHRAQRALGKNGRGWAGSGCVSGTRMHAGAPEATALIGNVIAPDRLRVLAFADDAAEMPKLDDV